MRKSHPRVWQRHTTRSTFACSARVRTRCGAGGVRLRVVNDFNIDERHNVSVTSKPRTRKATTKSAATSKPSVAAKSKGAKAKAGKVQTAKAKVAKSQTAKTRVVNSPSGRGPKAGKPMPRWSAADVQLLSETVANSRTAREAFAKVAQLSGRSAGTVQAKYYQLQKQAGGAASRVGARRRSQPAATKAASPVAVRPSRTTTGSAGLRSMSIDELVSHAREVKSEIDRRRRELDDATRLFK